MTREQATSEFNNYGYTIGEQNSIIDRIYDDFEKELKQGQDNYNKLWDMYSELKKEKDNNERI